MLIGRRKLYLAILILLLGGVCDVSIPEGISQSFVLLLLGIYTSFAIGNITEHICSIFKKEPTPKEEDLAESSQGDYFPPETQLLDAKLTKILEAQDSSLKALNYLVSYVQSAARTTA